MTNMTKKWQRETEKWQISKCCLSLSYFCHVCHSVSLSVSQFYFCLNFHLYYLALSFHRLPDELWVFPFWSQRSMILDVSLHILLKISIWFLPCCRRPSWRGPHPHFLLQLRLRLCIPDTSSPLACPKLRTKWHPGHRTDSMHVDLADATFDLVGLFGISWILLWWSVSIALLADQVALIIHQLINCVFLWFSCHGFSIFQKYPVIRFWGLFWHQGESSLKIIKWTEGSESHSSKIFEKNDR